MSARCLLSLYQPLVRSIVEYGAVVWSPDTSYDVLKLRQNQFHNIIAPELSVQFMNHMLINQFLMHSIHPQLEIEKRSLIVIISQILPNILLIHSIHRFFLPEFFFSNSQAGLSIPYIQPSSRNGFFKGWPFKESNNIMSHAVHFYTSKRRIKIIILWSTIVNIIYEEYITMQLYIRQIFRRAPATHSS